LGRQHVRGGWITFTAQKNLNRKPITIEVPMLPVLRSIIDASPTGDLTYLVTDYGAAFTPPVAQSVVPFLAALWAGNHDQILSDLVRFA
jgi:hypothetical protein